MKILIRGHPYYFCIFEAAISKTLLSSGFFSQFSAILQHFTPFQKDNICSFGFSWGQSLLISDVQQQNCEMSTIIMTGLQELQLYYIQPQPESILDLYPAVKLQLKER